MKELKKRESIAKTVESFATKDTIVGCICRTCTCPPPSVPNDIQLQKQSEVSRAKTVAGS